MFQEDKTPVLVMCLLTSTKPGLMLRVTAENITQTSSVSGTRLKTRRSGIYQRITIIIIINFGLDCTEADLGQIRATLHSVTGGQDSQIMLDSAL